MISEIWSDFPPNHTPPPLFHFNRIRSNDLNIECHTTATWSDHDNMDAIGIKVRVSPIHMRDNYILITLPETEHMIMWAYFGSYLLVHAQLNKCIKTPVYGFELTTDRIKYIGKRNLLAIKLEIGADSFCIYNRISYKIISMNFITVCKGQPYRSLIHTIGYYGSKSTSDIVIAYEHTSDISDHIVTTLQFTNSSFIINRIVSIVIGSEVYVAYTNTILVITPIE